MRIGVRARIRIGVRVGFRIEFGVRVSTNGKGLGVRVSAD